MMGKPVIAGNRITVELILEKLAAGETIDQIVEAHPRLSRDAIHEALSFAEEVLKADVIYPISEARAWTLRVSMTASMEVSWTRFPILDTQKRSIIQIGSAIGGRMTG